MRAFDSYAWGLLVPSVVHAFYLVYDIDHAFHGQGNDCPIGTTMWALPKLLVS